MSGGKREVFNLRERAVSPDHNRTQRFTAYERAEMLGALLGSNPTVAELSSLSSYRLPLLAIPSPLEAHVLDGVMPIFEVGGDEVGMQPGLVLLYDPDGITGSSESDPPNPDDSSWKLARTAGFSIGSGTLTLTPNATGNTVWDVIECRRAPGVVTETDTREVFDATAGVFVPTLVNKVVQDQLQFRIRRELANPAPVQGWLPLAIASVANLATTWDDCTIFDVRPLVRERMTSMPFTKSPTLCEERVAHLWNDMATGVEASIKGLIKLSDPWGYMAGGKVVYPSAAFNAGIDREAFDIFDAAFQEPGLVINPDQLYYVWLIYPYGLPRWRVYSAGVVAPYGGRVPQGMCGIPVLTGRAPTDIYGMTPNAGIVPPPVTGLPATAHSDAVMMVPVVTNSSSDFLWFIDDGVWCVLGYDTAVGGGSVLGVSPQTATTAAADFYDLIPGTHFPRNAKALLLQFNTQFTGVGGTVFTYVDGVLTASPGSTVFYQALGKQSVTHQAAMPGGGTMDVTCRAEVQIHQDPALSPVRVGIEWQPTAGIAIAGAGGTCTVLGWRT